MDGISGPRPCTIDAVRTYFHNGTLPEKGTVCRAPDAPQTFSEEDMRIHAAYRDLGRAFVRENWVFGRNLMGARVGRVAQALYGRQV